MTDQHANIGAADPVEAAVPHRVSLAYFQQILEAIRRMPGVQAAGSARDLPLLGNGEQVRPGIPGSLESQAALPSVRVQHVSSGYFSALGTPLRQGRDFDASDRAGAPVAVILNAQAARQLFPTGTALGSTITFGSSSAHVVGIVGDVRQQSLAEPAEATIYLHALQTFRSRMSIVVRVNGAPESFAANVRRAIWTVDPLQTITRVVTYDSILGAEVARPRLLAWLLATFGVIGLTLGGLGIFGVLSFAVGQQRKEIGVRLALGATPASILRGLVVRGVLLAAGGLALGLIAALALSRWMQAVLFDIAPSDPWTLAQVGVVLLAAGLLASWIPAHRALTIDPVTALRSD